MVNYSFTGTITLGVGSTLLAKVIGPGTIVIPGSSIPVNFTALANATAESAPQTVAFGAEVRINISPVPNTAVALPTFYHAVINNAVAAWTPFAYPQVVVTAVGVAATAASTTSQNQGAGVTEASAPTATTGNANSNSGTVEASTGQSSTRPGYSVGVLAGAVIGCALGAALLAAIAVYFCLRKRRASAQLAQRETEKQLPLLPGHGEAVYVTGTSGWEKSLPQADSDSTIRSMTSRTVDQIAMHVENFYGTKNKIVLDTEHEFELESIDSSHLSEPITSLLPRCSHPEDLIKHYISSYIVSMINFEGSGANGMFLPKTFRKQWQPVSQEANSVAQAYSQWRVLTAYLRQQGNEEQTFISERNSIIDTAAGHICKAFEPWARADESTRFQNLVSIMRRASELGVQLFSQPARFEWQWQRSQTIDAGTATGSGTEVAILPGLYKTTQQNAVPLATPLRLVEPVMVVL